MDRRVRMRKKW